MLLGFAGIIWQWHHATQARDIAQNENYNKELQRQQAEQARAEAVEERKKTQLALYFARITQSQLQWRLSNVTGAVKSLMACLPMLDQVDPRELGVVLLAGSISLRTLYVEPHTRRERRQRGISPRWPDDRLVDRRILHG